MSNSFPEVNVFQYAKATIKIHHLINSTMIHFFSERSQSLSSRPFSYDKRYSSHSVHAALHHLIGVASTANIREDGAQLFL